MTNILDAVETEVLDWLSKGKRYEDISEICGIPRNTVATRAKRVMDKLGACTSAGAVGIGLRRGIIK